ncbi:MAG: hypothetical protein NC102_10155 [Clostridium sp.]|nr:hypothetical protein [Clostridium sp.]
MKKTIFAIVLFIVFTLASPHEGYAAELNIYVNAINIEEDPVPRLDPDGERAPSRPIRIKIDSEEGVSIPGVDAAEVISYSLYDEEGMLIASYANDIDFAQAVLSMSGVVDLRIELPEYCLCGWLHL